jgi:hypothetical protein
MDPTKSASSEPDTGPGKSPLVDLSGLLSPGSPEREAWASRVQELSTGLNREWDGITKPVDLETILSMPAMFQGPASSWRQEFRRLGNIQSLIKNRTWYAKQHADQVPMLMSWMEDRGFSKENAPEAVATAEALAAKLPESKTGWWGLPTVDLSEDAPKRVKLYLCLVRGPLPTEGHAISLVSPWDEDEPAGTATAKAPPFRIPHPWFLAARVPAILEGLVVATKKP